MKKLHFGSGKIIKHGYINADITKFPGVDVAFDFEKFPYPFEDNEFDEIFSDNVLEHLGDITRVMRELHRISKPGAKIRIIVPHYNCYGAYNDVTHKHYFSHLAFEPFYKTNPHANYFIQERFKLDELNLIPTRFGKIFMHDSIRLPVSFFVGQVFKAIDVRLQVQKAP